MATDNFSSMFGMVSPEQAQQAYLAQAQKRNMELAQLPLERMGIAMMGNIGSRLGTQAGRMFGGQTAMESEQAVMKDIFNKAAAQSSDPVERLEIAATMFDSIDPAKAQALRDKAMEFKKEKADISYKEAQAKYWGTTKGTGKGNGTGPERMIQHIAKVQNAINNKQPVTPEEMNLARGYASYLSKKQYYKLDDGSIVEVDKNDFSRINQVLSEGGVPVPVDSMLQQPSAGTAPTTPQPPTAGATAAAPAAATAAATAGAPQKTIAPGVRVIKTPESDEAVAKKQMGFDAKTLGVQEIFSSIAEAKNAATPFSSGGVIAQMLSPFWGSPSKALDARLQTVKANLGFDRLQAMRDASPTGGALGQVAIQELEALQNSLTSLQQTLDPEEIKAGLDKVETHYMNWLGIMEKHGKAQGIDTSSISAARAAASAKPPASATPPATGTKATKLSAADSALVDRVANHPRNAGKSRESIERALRKQGRIK